MKKTEKIFFWCNSISFKLNTKIILMWFIIPWTCFASNQLDTNWRDYFVRRTLNPIGIVQTIYVDNTDLYIGGMFDNMFSQFHLNNLAHWQDSLWIKVGTDNDYGTNGYVNKIIKKDGLIIGGIFDTIGTLPIKSIAKWTGTNWQSFGNGINGEVNAIAFKNSLMFVVGFIDTAGTIPVQNIAYWDGTEWNNFGDGVRGDNWLSFISDIIIYDSLMYICGDFDTVGNVAAKNIAQWNFNTNSWSNIGDINERVRTMCIANNILYIGGDFDTITKDGNPVPASNIAKYNNGEWSALGPGTNGEVYTLMYNNGLLYAGGFFTLCGNDTVNNIAQWNGVNWQSLGSGVNGGSTLAYVSAISAKDSVIYVGGSFAITGEILSNNIGVWSLTPLDPPLNFVSVQNTSNLYTPINVEIQQNYLNNTITFCLDIKNNSYGKLSIKLIDLLGRVIPVIDNKQIFSGQFQYEIDRNIIMNSVYICQIQFNDVQIIKKLILIR